MTRADQYSPIESATTTGWDALERGEGSLFLKHLGLVLEEVRRDYARMRLPWRPEVTQPAGVAHGGALASLIDSVVVPAIASGYDEAADFVTVDLHVSFMDAMIDEDAVAEGWIVKRGGSIIFCAAEVVGADTGRLLAQGTLTYKLVKRRN